MVRTQKHIDLDNEEYYEVELSIRRNFEWSGFQYRLSLAGEVLDAREIEFSPRHLKRW